MIRFFLLFILSGFALVHAAEVEHLYSADVPVQDQGQEERNRAIQAGFAQVLTKVTGNSDIENSSALKSILSQASRYVQQYRYQVLTSPEAVSQPEMRVLQVAFDKYAVDRLLRDRSMPVWGKSRPQVLAWVGFEDKGKRNLLIPEFDQAVVSGLNKAASIRGIPFLLPLMDLEDQSALSTSDLWGTFEKNVREASSRYAADVILLVTLKPSSADYWTSRWTLLDQQGTHTWDIKGNGRFQVLQDGINRMSDILSQLYAPAGGSQTEQINVQVDAVRSFSDLVRMQSFLDNLETVQDYNVRAIDGEKVLLNLNLRGGIPALKQAVALSGFMIPQENAMDTTVEINVPAATDDQIPEDNEQPLSDPAPIVDEIQLYYRLR